MGGAFTPANKKCYKGNITLLSGAEREYMGVNTGKIW